MNYGLSRTKRMDLVSAEERFFYDRLLRQEADHRLANLLQIVSGNLTRSCRDGSTEQARRLIGAAADQIVALGKLHQALAQPSEMRTEDGSSRLQILCSSLKKLVIEPRGHVLAFRTEGGEPGGFPLRSDIAHCLVLIVSEFIINAAKHAFSPDTTGNIRVLLGRSADRLSCTVSDDGAATLSHDDCFTSQGMCLARDLAQRAGGNCNWVFNPTGTEAHVSLPFGLQDLHPS